MKKFLLIAALQYVLISLDADVARGQSSLHVSTTGSDANPGTVGAPLRNIQTALSRAADGDTIKVAAGTYGEGLVTQVRVIMRGGYSSSFTEADRDLFTNMTVIEGVSTVMLNDPQGSTIDGFVFDGNGIPSDVGVRASNGTVISHNIIRRVSAPGAVGLETNGGSIVVNNIIVSCGVGLDIFSATGTPSINNNIIAYNSFGVETIGYSAAVRTYNDVALNTFNYIGFDDNPGIGDISLDPQFRDRANLDYRLLPSSPCIDAGDPSDPVGEEPEPNGGRINMGAYGGTGNATAAGAAPTVTTGAATDIGATTATLNGTVNPNGSSTDAYFEWGTSSTLSTFDTTPSQSIGSGTSDVSVVENLTGLSINTTYYFRVVGQNGVGTEKGSIVSFTTSATTASFHVSTTGSDANAGTVGAPLRTIQTALIRAADGDTIKVAAGTYGEGLVTQVRVIMRGGYPESFAEAERDLFANMTIIEGVSTVMLNDPNGSTIDGFVFDGNGIPSDVGIKATDGTVISHNIIRRVSAAATVGIETNGGSIVVNNTIVDCASGIDILSGSGIPSINNNIIAYNSFGVGTIGYSAAVRTYNDVALNTFNYTGFDNNPGIGDLSLDPQFRDRASLDYRLLPSSPCIDAGDPSDPVGEEPEPNGGRINMGAYGGTGNATAAGTAPTVTTDAATNVSATAASLNGTVNPNGSSTDAYFEWGTSSTLSTFDTTPSQSIGSGTSAVSVTENLTTLNPSTTYYYRVVGQNSAGTRKGSIVSFTSVPAEPFTDISVSLTGVKEGSVAWGDYDNDGDLDILLTGQNSSLNAISVVYRNDSGSFVDISAGLAGVQHSSVAWGDYDNDADLDILLTGGLRAKVYRNDNGSFIELPAELAAVGWYSSAAWGDYDNDGDLDILLTGYSSPNVISKIYRNDGGSFVDINASLVGVWYSSVAWGDYDNDEDLDILLTGTTAASGSSSGVSSRIYRNDGNGIFTDISAGLTGVLFSSVAWGDYDNDGDLDILLAGLTGVNHISKIYRNDNGTFTDISAGLSGGQETSVAWGDYDNDGDLDVLVAGLGGSKVYRNDDGAFVNISAALAGVYVGSSAWGDYDNDGDLDILLTGNSSGTRISKVYRNNSATANTAPSVPTGLASLLTGNSVSLSWNKSTDIQTSQNGLTYNLRVGTASGGVEIVTPMADLTIGYRKVPKLGNTNHNNTWVIQDLPARTYYWSVQAIDNAYAGSAFASEQSFTIAAGGAAPTVATDAASNVSTGSATLNGTVNPNGESTTAWFEWGTSSTLSAFDTTPSQSIGSGTSALSVTESLTGLDASTTYYHRAVGQNSAGIQKGSIESFTTTSTTGQDYYVDASTGSNTTGNGTQSSPWKTITHALSQITGSPHTLHVAAGTYDTALGETFPILMKNGISLVGAGIDISIIDANNTNTVTRCISIVDPTTRIEGFTIKNGLISEHGGGGIHITAGSALLITGNLITENEGGDDSGAGIYMSNSSPTITGNLITENNGGRNGSGGGIYISNSSPTIENNTISSNRGYVVLTSASAIYVTGASSFPIITNNTIEDNYNTGGGGSVDCGTFVLDYASNGGIIKNNLILNNTSDYTTTNDNQGVFYMMTSSSAIIKNNIIAGSNMIGINAGYLASPTIVSNTISDNSVDGIRLYDVPGISSPDSIINNIISYNDYYGINGPISEVGKVWYNLFYLNTEGLSNGYYTADQLNSGVAGCENNIEGNPLFEDRTNGDYHLRASSPAIDAGDPNSPLDPDGTRADIGALYFSQVIPAAPTLSSPPDGGTGQSITPTLSWNASVGATSYRLQVSTSSTFTATVFDDSAIITTSAQVGPLENNTSYYWRVRAKNASGTSGYSTTWSFTTISELPSVTTNAASSVMSSSATLNGSVNPNGVSTTAWFEWGTSGTLSMFDTTPSQSIGSGMSAVSVTENLTALNPSTTYYYRVVGQNSAGTQRGTITSFATGIAGGAPTVATKAASSVATTSATLNGTVNPNGLSTTVSFEWGETTSYGNTASASPSPVTGTGDISVVADLTGLSENTEYHYRVVAVNDSGRTDGGDQTFTTLSSGTAPTVTTEAASDVGTTSATLNGTVSSNGLTTTVIFQYGPTTSYGSEVTAAESPVTGTSPVAVRAQVTGLSPDTTYYYRVVGTNNAGTTNGADQTFTTASAGAVPTVTTEVASNVSTTSASLNGTVNPNGLSTTVTFEWGETASYGNSITASQSPVSGTNDVPVSAGLAGLLENTEYHYRVVATNSAGTTNGADQTFTTTSPATIALTLGNNQSATISTALTNPFVVTVADAGSNPVEGVAVTFAIASVPGGATGHSLSVTNATTDAQGQASSVLTLGDKMGEYVVTATSTGLAGSPVTFTATATVPPPPATVDVVTTVSFPSRSSPSDYRATDYRIVGLPGASNRPVNELLSGSQNSDWQLYWDNGASSNFLVEFDGGSNFVFSVGRAFWLVAKGPWNVNTSATFAPLDASEAANIPLRSGWNLITNPFDSPIEWSKIQDENGGFSQPIWSYNGSFSQSTSFDPYVGYYFDNSAAGLSSLKVPYSLLFSPILAAYRGNSVDWMLTIELSSGDLVEKAVSLGVSEDASIALDRLDFRKPRTVSPVAAAYFHRPEWDAYYSSFATDIRPDFEESEGWEFEVYSTQREQSVLAFTGVGLIPSQFDVYLIDANRTTVVNLRTDSLYSFIPATDVSKFSVLIGREDALSKTLSAVLPREFSLGSNFPNPFNPSTTIPVDIPFTSEVSLKIYSILGEEIGTLFSGNLEAGRHWFDWDGRRETGTDMSSGVYIYRLATNTGVNLARKMVLVK